MKIALITDAWFPQVNGVVRTLSNVQRELEAAGDEFLVVNPSLHRTIPCPRYPEIRLALNPFRGLGRRLDAFAPDAIHIATEGPLGLAARRYCRRRRVPFTTSYHTQFPYYLRSYVKVPVRVSYAAMRWFHNAAERTLVPTPSVKRELDGRGFTGVRAWTRGVDTDLFRPLPEDAPGPLPDLTRPIFVYVGRVAVEKNIEAFLALDLPGTKLVIGDGPALPRLRRAYPDAVFAGYRHGEDLAAHLAAGDVFVFPSRTDTYGVVMLEAMACGLPVAAYPVTGPIDVVRPGVTGVLDEDLARAALAALDLDPMNCRAQAEAHTWRRCAEVFRDTLAPISVGIEHARTTASPR